MACKTWNVKTKAIYNLGRNLLLDKTSGVETFNDVLKYFHDNYIDNKDLSKENQVKLTERDVIDAFISADEKAINQSKQEFNKKIGGVRSQARLLNRLDMFLHGVLQASTSTKERSDAQKEVDQVFKQFKDLANKKQLTDADIDLTMDMVNALPVNLNIKQSDVESAFNQLVALKKVSQDQRDQQKVEKLSDKLTQLFKGEYKAPEKKTKIPSEEHLQEFKKVMTDLYKLAGKNTEIPQSEIANIVEKLENVEDYYLEHYNADGLASEEAIKNAINNLREVRGSMKLESIQGRIKEYNDKVKTLDRALKGEDVDFSNIIVDNTGIPWRGKQNELVLAEHELNDAKDNLKALQNEILFKKKIDLKIDQIEKSWGIDIKGKAAEGMLTFYYSALSKGWNSIRTLKFMLDNSAFFTQLAPLVLHDFASTPITTLQWALGDKNVDPLAGLHRIRDVWTDGFWKIATQSITKNQFKNSGNKWYNVATGTKGDYAKQMYHDITQHDLYHLMIESGLKISRSRSLVDSEEYFKDSLVNNIPGLGFLKDVSEDIMVTSLNMYRTLMFTQYHEMHPNLTLEQYKQAAEGINILTGTTNRWGKTLGPAAAILSAPRLMVSRIISSISYPLQTLTRIDFNKSIKSGNLKYRDEYSAFIARQTAGMFAGIGLIMLASSALLGAVPGKRWDEKDFFKIRLGDKSYDFTGGMASIYKTLALMWVLTFGPSESASYSNKKRIEFMKSAAGGHEDAMDALWSYGRTKLNPAITGPYQILTGRDFIGRPFASTPAKSRLDATWRIVAPISLESTIDELKTDDNLGEQFVDMGLQIHGVNVFQYDSGKQNVNAEQIINKLQYSPDIRYPDGMSKRNGKEVADTMQKEYLKNKYKQMWGDELAKFILSNPNITADQLKNGWGPRKNKVDQEFIKEYGDNIKQLELKK